jgi:hypothetical protein
MAASPGIERELYGSLLREVFVGAVEESPLLRSVTGKRLMKTNRKTACAVVIGKVWKSAMAP